MVGLDMRTLLALLFAAFWLGMFLVVPILVLVVEAIK